MSYILFAWVAVIFFGFEIIVSKLILKHTITNPWLFNFIASLCFVCYVIPVALINHAGIPKDWNFILEAAIINTLIFILNSLNIYMVDVSILNPFGNLRAAFGVIFSGIFLGEILHSYQYFLIALMFFAGIFASIDEKLSPKSFFKWPILLVIINMAISGFIGILINRSSSINGFWTTNLWMFFLTQILLLLTIPLFKNSLKKVTKKRLYPIAIVSLFGFIGTFAVNKAFTQNVGITNSITSIPSAMILAFCFSIFAPKLLEKHPLKVYIVRFISAIVMIIAAIKLSS